MRDPFDVRDVSGRLNRLLAAIPLGILTSLAVTFALPTRRHYDGWVGCVPIEGGWFVTGGSPTLVVVGAILSTLAWSAALQWVQRRKLAPATGMQPLPTHGTTPPPLPMARLVRDRRTTS